MTRPSQGPPCPRWLLLVVYLFYLGLPTTASVPLFAEIDWLHEGERMGIAQAVLSGGLPIRDVYAVHGLFPEVIRPLLAFWLFGESLASDRLFGMLLEPLAYVAAVFYLWRLFPTPFWRVAGLVSFALFPLLLLPRHVAVFLTLGLLAAWDRNGASRRLFAAGVIAGLGYVISTMDQASFLLATVLTFPVAVVVEQGLRRRGSSPEGESVARPARAVFLEVVRPLYTGVLVGLLPFLAYLTLTGTAGLFVDDILRRGQADLISVTRVFGIASYPSLSVANWLWYAVPLFYGGLTIWILIRATWRKDKQWTAIWPTVLFGIFSFVYVRHPSYWKLAVVAFPFIVGLVYVLSVLVEGLAERSQPQVRRRRLTVNAILAGLTAALMLVVLVQALTREWKPQEIAPRVVFPALTLLVLGAVAVGYGGRIRSPWPVKILMVAPPLAAVIVAVWFFHDAKPQLIAALVKKPRLVRDGGRLIESFASTGWRLTRERPLYLGDEVVSYLKESAKEGKHVVVLGAGAGIYYFLSGTTPPNRFPGIETALADAWAEEVVAGLKRTGAELLVGCRDGGRSVTGWPMNPILADFIAAHYVDTGRRLQDKMPGNACSFAVWAPGVPETRRF